MHAIIFLLIARQVTTVKLMNAYARLVSLGVLLKRLVLQFQAVVKLGILAEAV